MYADAEGGHGTYCRSPTTAGGLGSPPKPDGKCQAPLVVDANNICSVPPGMDPGYTAPDGTNPAGGGGGHNQPPKSNNTCKAPAVLNAGLGLCIDPNLPRCGPDYIYNAATDSCDPPIPECPAGQQYDFDTERCELVIPDCSVPVGTEIVHQGNNTQTTFCTQQCVFTVMARACSSVSACNLYGKANGAECVEPPTQGCPPGSMLDYIHGTQFCITATTDNTTPAAPGEGCADGFHNDNQNPATCVADTVVCQPGQHVSLVAGYEICVSDTAPDGTPGTPPGEDGLCQEGLVNVGGICTDPAGVSGGTGPGGTVGGSTQSGQCGSPGFPECKTDAGRLIGDLFQGTETGDPEAKTSADITAALGLDSLNPLKSFAMPAHSSSCPTIDFTVPLWGESFHIDQHCTLLDTVAPIISAVMMLGWFIAAMFIVLGA